MKTPALPAFLVTIDTEGDNLWSRPRTISTRNAACLGRFQQLCESRGMRPTWLVDYEMALDEHVVAFGRDVLRRDAGEIGMHLHAWNTPPIEPLTDDDFFNQPYLPEFPAAAIEAKVRFMTELLRDRFETPIVSHRAGRWALDATYARTLAQLGYQVDCSVCPQVSWSQVKGAPDGSGGPDYRGFPQAPYFLDLDHIDRPGRSNLLELPVSVMRSRLHRLAPWTYVTPGLRRWAWAHSPDRIWLYPDGRNLSHLLRLLERALAERRPYVEMVLHSSELMPGGSPNGADEASIERLHRDLDMLFAVAARHFAGMTLSEFRLSWITACASGDAASPGGRRPAFAQAPIIHRSASARAHDQRDPG